MAHLSREAFIILIQWSCWLLTILSPNTTEHRQVLSTVSSVYHRIELHYIFRRLSYIRFSHQDRPSADHLSPCDKLTAWKHALHKWTLVAHSVLRGKRQWWIHPWPAGITGFAFQQQSCTKSHLGIAAAWFYRQGLLCCYSSLFPKRCHHLLPTQNLGIDNTDGFNPPFNSCSPHPRGDSALRAW